MPIIEKFVQYAPSPGYEEGESAFYHVNESQIEPTNALQLDENASAEHHESIQRMMMLHQSEPLMFMNSTQDQETANNDNSSNVQIPRSDDDMKQEYDEVSSSIHSSAYGNAVINNDIAVDTNQVKDQSDDGNSTHELVQDYDNEAYQIHAQ